MIEPYHIIETLLDYYDSEIKKHIINIGIMLYNPMAFHDHDKFNEAIENQLDLIAQANDRKEALTLARTRMPPRAVPLA